MPEAEPDPGRGGGEPGVKAELAAAAAARELGELDLFKRFIL